MRAALAMMAVGLLPAGLVACGPGPAPVPVGRCDQADAGPSCVELGVGPDAAIAVDTVPLVHGPQGGWHLEVGLRFRATEVGDDLAVEYEARGEDDRVLGSVRYAIEPRRLVRDGESILRQGDIVILDVASGDEVLDTRVTIEVRISQGDAAATPIDERALRVVAAP